MKFLKKIASAVEAQKSIDESLYAAVLNEVNHGMIMGDLWAKVLVDNEFNLESTKASYIHQRVVRLKRKFQSILEYQALMENNKESVAVLNRKAIQHDEKIKVHQKKLNSLQEEVQKVVDEIMAKKSAFYTAEKQAESRIREETKKEAPERARQNKNNLIIGALAGAATLTFHVLSIHPITTFIGVAVSVMSFASAFINLGDENRQIADSKRLLALEYSVKELEERRDETMQKYRTLKSSPPEPESISNPAYPSRRIALEKELENLFDLQPIKSHPTTL